jgi:glycosyltransferase involved in cell wall biosynthesis
MTVSVIITTYNYAPYLREAINSVLSQTIEDLQILVVDDGSTDNTPEILASLDDPRIEVIRTPHQGSCATRNEGLVRARGEFVAFLDADDRFLPDKLERQVSMMEAEPDLVAVLTNFVRFDDSGIYPRDQFFFFPELATASTSITQDGGGHRIIGDAFCTLVSFNEIPAWGGVMLWRASAIQGLRFAVNGLHKGLCGDLHFGLRAFRLGGVGFIQQPLAQIRRHSNNATSRASDMPYAKLAALQLVLGEQLRPKEKRALRRRVGRALIEVGLQNMADHRLRAAAAAFASALPFRGARLSALKNLVLLGLPKQIFER